MSQQLEQSLFDNHSPFQNQLIPNYENNKIKSLSNLKRDLFRRDPIVYQSPAEDVFPNNFKNNFTKNILNSNLIVGGWKELGRKTLGSATSTIDLSGIPDKRYYMILVNYAASIDSEIRFNGISTNTYADRISLDGASDVTNTSATFARFDPNGAGTNARFIVGYASNLASVEKLIQAWTVKQQAPGSGTAPNRTEAVGKHSQTTNPIDQMTIVNTGGNFPIGAELVVLGWDPADVHTTNFWEQLASISNSTSQSSFDTGVFTAKKYLWIQAYIAKTGGTANLGFRVGNTTIDTGNNYARKNK